MATRKTLKRKSAKRKSTAKDAMRRLISDVVSDPRRRAALYRNPKETAKKYGLTAEEGKALLTVKKSLLSAMGRKQTSALNALFTAKSRPYGPGPAGCTPNVPQRCRPNGCEPGSNCPPDIG